MMKREYDFSRAVRGKFYRKGGVVRLPIYLDQKLQNRVEHLAQGKRKDINDFVNQLIKKEIEILEEWV